MAERQQGRQYKDIPITGKLITSVDPIKIQPDDLQTLTNLRPTDDSPKGVRGMTKINAEATAYLGLRTGYHFKKDQPSENHILVQTNDTVAPATASRLVKSDGTTSIPAQDTLTAFLTLDNNNPVNFSKAPDGCVAAFNGTKNYIWGGNESRCYGFIRYDADNADTTYDYTDVINNTLTDALNVATMATIGGGLDADVKLLYHLDNAKTDSSGNGHDLSDAGGAPTFSTTTKKMGTHAAQFNGASYYSLADHADTDMSGGIWTVDAWVYVTDLSTIRGIFGQLTDANNYIGLFINTNGTVNLKLYTVGAEKLGSGSGLITPINAITVNQWYHVEAGGDNTNYYIFVNGVLLATEAVADNPLDYTGLTVFGYNPYAVASMVGYMDEIRLTVGACRHTASFTPPISPYSASATCSVYIASTRPLQGLKMYVGTANATAATVAGNYWNGAWTALSNVVDNTDIVATKTLSGTGTITWDDTSSDAKVKIINNQQYYWYQIVFTGIDATTTVYYCTLNAKIQAIKDIWDGNPRIALSMMTYTTSYSDYTLAVYQNDYDSGDTGTFVNVSDMTTAQHFIVGFAERTMGIYFYFAEAWVNTTASTVCTIYYWNGSAWVTVGALNDGTSQAGISFSRSGIISWDAPTSSSEFQWTPNNGVPMYYYKVLFNQTIDNTDSKIYIDYITGIPAQSNINSYKFPLFWRNMLLLCGDQSGRKNMIRYTVPDSNCVLNGTGSGEIPIDGDDELMAGATLFTRFGGDIYDSAVLCKRGQTFILGIDENGYITVDTVSSNKGCVAPYTMKLCDIGFDIASNIRKHIIVWLSSSGLMVFDGVSIGTISDYFDNIFDPLDTDYINTTYIDDSTGEYDPVNHEYILMWPSGATPTWKETHYRLKQQAPFYVDRGTGKSLRCVFPVEDSNGNKYMYGGTNDGFIERLEYGQTMDGNGIAYTFRMADINLSGSVLQKTRVTGIQLIGKSKTAATAITAKHYVDGITTGTSYSTTISQIDAAHRIFRAWIDCNGLNDAIFHSTEFTITTTAENRGFEPLMVSYEYELSGDVRSKGG